MSEHDEDQAPPAPWLRAAHRRDDRVARDEGQDGQDSQVVVPNPWSSPGRGQPYPGEVGAADPRPTPWAATTAFRYPYPEAGGGTPTYPYTGGGDASMYGTPGPYEPPAPGYSGGGLLDYDDAPSYPGYASPNYADLSAYSDQPPYGATPPYGGDGTPGAPGAPGYPAGPGYPTYPGYGTPAGWSGGWQPPPPPTYGSWTPAPQPGWGPPPRPSHTRPLTIVLVAILVAALVGLSIGGQLVARHTTIRRIPTFFPAQPSDNGNGGVASSGGGLPADQAQAIANAVDPSVVDINAKLGYQRAAAAGTGMVLTSDGEVLTNNHVIAGATSLTAMVVGGKNYTVKVLGTDPTEDVALIKLEGASGLRPITTGDPKKLAAGDPIVAVGNAGGVGGTPTVVTGTVEALDQSVTASDVGGGNSEQLFGLIEINAPLQPGDSGGPLINTSSQVVGMNTAASASNRVESQSSVGFAIPITKAMAIAKQIAAGQASATIQLGLPAFIGVSIATDAPATVGAPVARVFVGSPADKAGVVAGDVITSLGGQSVDSPRSLTAAMLQHHPGDKVSIGWTDATGKKHTASVMLTTGPAA
ncbi:MAG: hypothetical protein QOF30_2630 [Acidimicrobiaceae bacterium]|jgi:S1-C subfamily serine protease|nr:hypothetical protein [Acidimicrobiaceae bacterium]